MIESAARFCYSCESALTLASNRFRLHNEEAAISSRPVRVNERIRIREVRLIDENGKQVGVIPTVDALATARERGLDLVEVQPNAVPPVCRLMDYGRFRYEESRKEREARRKQKAAILKEIRLKPNMDDHDLDYRTKQARKFLQDGDKVKFSVRFRGRQNLHKDIGRDLLLKVIEDLREDGSVDQPPKSEGSDMSIIISPRVERTVEATA